MFREIILQKGVDISTKGIAWCAFRCIFGQGGVRRR